MFLDVYIVTELRFYPCLFAEKNTKEDTLIKT